MVSVSRPPTHARRKRALNTRTAPREIDGRGRQRFLHREDEEAGPLDPLAGLRERPAGLAERDAAVSTRWCWSTCRSPRAARSRSIPREAPAPPAGDRRSRCRSTPGLFRILRRHRDLDRRLSRLAARRAPAAPRAHRRSSPADHRPSLAISRIASPIARACAHLLRRADADPEGPGQSRVVAAIADQDAAALQRFAQRPARTPKRAIRKLPRWATSARPAPPGRPRARLPLPDLRDAPSHVASSSSAASRASRATEPTAYGERIRAIQERHSRRRAGLGRRPPFRRPWRRCGPRSGSESGAGAESTSAPRTPRRLRRQHHDPAAARRESRQPRWQRRAGRVVRVAEDHRRQSSARAG